MISVIIPTYNKNNVLRHVILSLINQGIDRNDYEIIVSDDGGSENTKEMLNTLNTPLKIKYVWYKKQGFRLAKARNEGVKISSGEKLVFLDQDNILAPNSLKHLDFMLKRKSYYIGTKKLVPLKFYEEKINDDVILNKFEEFETQIHGELKSTLGSLGIMFKSDFDIVEGFDEQFQDYGLEDAEMMSRLKDIGICCLKSQAIAYHIEHPQGKTSAHNTFLFRQKNKNKTKDGKKVII